MKQDSRFSTQATLAILLMAILSGCFTVGEIQFTKQPSVNGIDGDQGPNQSATDPNAPPTEPNQVSPDNLPKSGPEPEPTASETPSPAASPSPSELPQVINSFMEATSTSRVGYPPKE